MIKEERIEEYVDKNVILNGLDKEGVANFKQLVKDVCIKCVENEIAELEAQIEKMKNRCNYKNGEYSCVGRAYFNCKLGINKCESCNKWEIKEND